VSHTRKIRSDLIDTYKIINGIISYNVKTELFFDYDQSGRRGHSKKLFKRSKIDLGWISENLHSVTEIKNRRHMKFIV